MCVFFTAALNKILWPCFILCVNTNIDTKNQYSIVSTEMKDTRAYVRQMFNNNIMAI
jgi:hypothetical protein